MSREIAKDYETLECFITQFDLSSIAENGDIFNRLKPMHKKLYSYMTIIAEIEHKNQVLQTLSDESLSYLKESVSDMGQALFCWVQGAYKPANLILRSSIETFIRAIAGQENTEIFLEKSMYRVFEIAQGTSFFSNELSQIFLSNIHSTYKDLCKIVHTADLDNMAHISALKAFPLFSVEKSQSFSRDFMKISTMFMSVIYVNFFKFIHTMHHKNQINFLSSIPIDTKRKINEKLG